MSVEQVQARISQIQGQLALLAPARTSASSSAFAATMTQQLAGTTATTSTTGGTASGEAVVAEAKKYLGVPYVWGGTNPKTGLDCSGLTQLVYGHAGVDLPRVSWQQARTGKPVDGLANARPGDLLAFNSPVDHVAIYLGGNQMIHAPKPGKSVEISDVYETPTAIRRVLPEEGSPRSAGGPYAALFAQAAQRTGVPVEVLSAVASAESGFDPNAVSPAGARGLMQLMPGTARELGVDPMNPASAIDGAARLLAAHLRDFGSLPLALAAYNAGPGAVRRADGIPPYPETQAYVRKILTAVGGSA